MKSSRTEDFPKPARVALWHAIDEPFGGVQYDNVSEAYWSDEIEVLEVRLRKRLRLLAVANERHVPDNVREFIIETATSDQLFAVAEETLSIALRSRMDPTSVESLAASLLQAFNEGCRTAHSTLGVKAL